MHEQSIEQFNHGYEEEGLMPESMREEQMSYKNMNYPLFRGNQIYFFETKSNRGFFTYAFPHLGPVTYFFYRVLIVLLTSL